MKVNPLLNLESFGQSIWLDFIRRRMLDSGELGQLIDEDGLGGVTSNPAIFKKAIAETDDYDDAIHCLARAGKSALEIYEELALEDIRRTADLFRPLYDRSGGMEGFVSLEVSPHLAYKTAATIAEGRRLWARVDRPNVLIKVPGTREGLPAIRQLISEGINVNVTLLFGLLRYREVTEAYIDGLAERSSRGLPLQQVTSVASFFLSRIDVLVDSILDKHVKKGGVSSNLAATLRGEVAIVSAKVAYRMYTKLFACDRFRMLAQQGARSQRLLWASTSTKNPAFSDVKYVDSLIGPETVNTIPLETLNAYRDHGNPEPRIGEGLDKALKVLAQLRGVGINLAAVTQQLEHEGVEKFVEPFDDLLESLQEKINAAKGYL